MPNKSIKRYYWNLGHLKFNNSYRHYTNINFTVGKKDYGAIEISNRSWFNADAIVTVDMKVGDNPKLFTCVSWECTGDHMDEGGKCYCFAIGNSFHWRFIFPPRGAVGRLSFGLDKNETVRHYKWKMKVFINGVLVNTTGKVYTLTLKRVV